MQKIGQPNQRQAEINLLLSLTQRLSVLSSLLHKDKARPCLCTAREVIRDLQKGTGESETLHLHSEIHHSIDLCPGRMNYFQLYATGSPSMPGLNYVCKTTHLCIQALIWCLP